MIQLIYYVLIAVVAVIVQSYVVGAILWLSPWPLTSSHVSGFVMLAMIVAFLWYLHTKWRT